ERLVQRLALGVQALERRLIGRQRPAAAPAPPPGGVDVDVDPHHEGARECATTGGGADRAAAECQHARPGLIEQLERDALLRRPERRLPIFGEHAPDRLAEALDDYLVAIERDNSPGLRPPPLRC